ncbi:zinc finger protein RFP-like [Lacerta agilis]|uniref:zinc finger protein RFP-like n=1 Tax=Lacerta agilis TaxID=80427 RepID=UPI00141996C7|nr:zinc finger protein RFP-like [Lacerta agilis]
MATSGGHIQLLRDEATCSICLDYFKDPVTIPECGHNYCRSCLIQCWGGSGTGASCPQCRKTVRRKSLIRNRQLANMVEIAQNLSLQEGEEEGGKGGVCEKHQEPLKLFCKEDEAPICVVCGKSKEHKHHEVIPLEEAFEEYKGEICRRLEILRKERGEMLACQADLEKECKDLLKLIETERLETVEKFKELHQFLEEQEKHLLNHVEEVEKEIGGRRDEELARLSRKLSSLERIIQEMEEKRQQPASELLQDVRRTLQRYEKRESPEKPLPFPPELRKGILKSCDIKHFVEDAMKQWKDALLSRKQIQKDVQSFRNLQRANVTLDPDTAHPSLILSKDLKSMRLGEKKQVLPDNPERFSKSLCVLGREGFRAGSHFWEVTVESGELWALGVARKSVGRKGIFPLSAEWGMWAVRNLGGYYSACTSPDSSPLSLSEDPKRIRVTLDYEGGRVSFSDADSGAALYTFSGASFSGETLLPIFHLWQSENPLIISRGRKGVMATSGGHIQLLRDEVTCSICLDYFKDPVTIPECGHNFCRSCLIQCWGGSGAGASCPQCRKRVRRKSLIRNRQLANMVEIAQNLSLQEGKEEGGKGGVCEKHQEPLKLFCKEEEAPICVVCGKSKEHKHHEMIPLEEAFEEYKGEICSCLEILRKEREEILAYQADLDKECKDLLKLTERERLKTVEKFKELRQFLEEQEKHLLNRMEEVEKEIAGRRDEELARLSRKLSSLERIIQEMEEKGQQPATELLQDVRSTLQRYEQRESPEKPLPFPPELRDGILESCDIKHFVEDAMKQWEDALSFRKQIQKANVTLDPDTAHPELILAKDRKSVRRGDKKQNLPDNPERFSYWPCVLGREGFRAGRHFWEVTVESVEWWALGVARKSVKRKGLFSLSPQEGVWAVQKWGNEYMTCSSTHLFFVYLSWDPKRIRVTLDYEGGRVSFSDADSGAALHTFSGASFSGETLFPFFHLWESETLIIS